jgi:hypothetical protein
MPQPAVAQPAIVMTRLWLPEHDWLHEAFASADNHSPRFRFPDLLSACVSLALADARALHALRKFLHADLSARDPACPRRSCHLWRAQFDEVLLQHRAAWNSHPHPKFDLDAIATGCVAVVRDGLDPIGRMLRQARLNFAARVEALPHEEG